MRWRSNALCQLGGWKTLISEFSRTQHYVGACSQPQTQRGCRLRCNFRMGKCKFNPLWLSDSKYDWVQHVPGNKWEALCRLCLKKIKLGTMGRMALESHMKSAKHLACSAATRTQTPKPQVCAADPTPASAVTSAASSTESTQPGEEHYNCISALHKSMRGSSENASLYWLGRMLEGGEDPLYVARRLVRFASEDVGMADPSALPQAVSAFQACHFIGMPECEVNLAQCVVYLARAPKSVDLYKAYNNVKACLRNHKGPLPSVPLHLRNAPTRLMKQLGYAKGYKYNPAFSGPVEQEYLPDELQGIDFFTWTPS